MDARIQARTQEKERLLARLAELEIEELRASGTFEATPHFSLLEDAAQDVGQALSRRVQERSAREVASDSPQAAACPGCGGSCPLETQRRVVRSVDGPIELDEQVGHCKRCRRSFFPSACRDGV